MHNEARCLAELPAHCNAKNVFSGSLDKEKCRFRPRAQTPAHPTEIRLISRFVLPRSPRLRG